MPQLLIILILVILFPVLLKIGFFIFLSAAILLTVGYFLIRYYLAKRYNIILTNMNRDNIYNQQYQNKQFQNHQFGDCYHEDNDVIDVKAERRK